MCGIAGIQGDADPLQLQTMIAKLGHRGPDGEGVHVDHAANVALGHCRLAIMDPIGGAQPIFSEDQKIVIIANGEIYNFPTLRADLQTRHHFRTSSDSEAIVHLFEEKGADAFAALDGMYAFALSTPDAFFMARDPIGIKPLYYGFKAADGAAGHGHATLYFASELKSLATVVEDIHEFPPGAYYDSRTGFVQFYTVPAQAPDPVPEEEALDEMIRQLRTTLEEVVVKHLMSDVPVGAFLSGGLDSSLLAAMARPHVDELHTFSVGIAGSPDTEAARLVAEHIGSIHHEYLYTLDEVKASLPAIIHHLESFDQDLVRSAIPCYFCSRLAAQYVKVILTGEGADELFAGYRYYKDYTDGVRLHQELRRSITALHNINLQRVDRLTMCHGLEGRVPFLDTKLIALAQSIPPAVKLKQTPAGQQIEKWILRKACEDLLPTSIVWREKAQFDEGSGTVDLLAPLIDEAVAGLDVEAYRQAHIQDGLRSAEECLYHKLLAESLPHPRRVLDNVGRWSGNHRV